MIMDNRFLTSRRTFDANATRYINAVQLADGQALEPEVAMAVDAFIKGCKADGIWSAIKASCIMAGARTISGALVPLVGPAPTPDPYNFTGFDYDRSTGLKGDGATTYLDSGRASDADGQDDCHLSVYETATHNDGSNYGASIGCIALGQSQKVIFYRVAPLELYGRLNEFNTISFARGPAVVGLTAVSRNTSSGLTVRYGGTDNAIAQQSVAMPSRIVTVFGQHNGSSVQNFANSRIAFYSIGSSLDLALLDNRVSTLISAIAAALS